MGLDLKLEDKQITKIPLYSWVLYKNIPLQLITLGVIVITVAMRVLPLEMQKLIINQAIGMKDLHKLYLYCGLYIGAVTLAGVLKYIINLLQNYIGERTLLVIRKRLYEHVLSLPMSFFRRTSPGQVISYMIAEFIPVSTFIGSAVAIPAVNVLTFLAMAGYMFYLNPLLGALSVSIYPIEVFVIPKLQKYFNKYNRERIDNSQKVAGLIGEAITGVHEVHSNASIPLEMSKFEKAVTKLYRSTLFMNALKYGIKFVNNLFQSMGPFILFLVGGYLAINGRFDLGSLVAFLSAYEKLYDPWKELMEFWQNYQDSTVRYKQVMEGFDIDPEFAMVTKGRDAYHLDNGIEVRDLSFVVGGNIKLLDRVSMEAKPGEHIALVGFSGSGKSTLALCVAQLYKYTSGKVTIGGKEVADLTKQDMVQNLSMVAQHPFIFDGSVKENLLYSCNALSMQGGTCTKDGEEPPLDKIIEIVQQVGLFLDVLSFGLRSTLDPKKDKDLIQSVINARKEFAESYADDLADDVEFYGEDKYSYYAPLGANITYGAPNDDSYDKDVLHENETFIAFLKSKGLYPVLTEFGGQMACRIVELISSAEGVAATHDKHPISEEEVETYKKLANRIEHKAELSEEDERNMLHLALTITPALHEFTEVPEDLAMRIVSARKDFQAWMQEHAPDVFTFHNSDQYAATGSIQNNIVYGRVRTEIKGAEERVNQQLMQLLIMEGVLEQVVELGLYFEVGSMGDRLSGGQRQKIALARTFLKNPPIIILDEATAALDNASQARVQRVLTNKWHGKSTVIAVIHRLDTLVNYDKVVVLKAGRIVEQGPYQELMDSKGALYQLASGKKH